ncbi:PEP/pyruvate-binding domain-containing protein [Candidatus Bipolaricaulota bacterium]
MSRMVGPLQPRRRMERFGGKASGLARLAKMGYDIPSTWVCSWRIGKRCLGNHTRTLTDLRAALGDLLDPVEKYAVRSSADVEDSAGSSCAGLFDTELHLQGADAVLDGMLRVWRSVENPRAQAMLREQTSAKLIRMSVLIQPMVSALCSGIAFSRNPITGYEEVVVEAVDGTSEHLTQGTARPVRWVIAPEASLSEEDETLSSLPVAVLGEIIEKTKRAAATVGYPVDLEWAYDGATLSWLQMRPITSLGSLAVYSNKMSREFLPGLIKPMVWSINVPMINGAWVRLFEEIVGPLDLEPKTLAKRFHYRAYFNMSGMGSLLEKLGFPRNTLEILLGLAARRNDRSPIRLNRHLIRHLPRAIRFMLGKLRFSRHVQAWIPVVLAKMRTLDDELSRLDSAADRIAFVTQLQPILQDIAYARIVTQLLHFIQTQRAEGLLKRWKWPQPLAVLENQDPRVCALGPSPGLRKLSLLLDRMDARQSALELSSSEFLDRHALAEFAEAFATVMRRFGAVSDSGNDFSSEPWSENPTKVLAMAARLDPGASHGADEGIADRRSAGRVRRLIQRCVRRRIDRETVGAAFSTGLGLLRRALMGIANAWVAQGWLDEREDIFYLEWDQVAAVRGGRHPNGIPISETVARERTAMAEAVDVQLPEMILGNRPPQVGATPSASDELRGIPASAGTFEGAVRVLRSTDDAAKLLPGDVLIIPYSDVGWVPLFHRAGAIVAEAGGTLSHASILARELHIPAVVSVDGACTLDDGTMVLVNGDEGTVTVKAADGGAHP